MGHVEVENLKRSHNRRLREVYRSAGWPYQDVIEIELLAAGLLERVADPKGVDCVRVTDAGIKYLAKVAQSHRDLLNEHNSLVDKVAIAMVRDGRLVWKNLALRARLPKDRDAEKSFRTCLPDIFSIRNSKDAKQLDPIVHEIKVSRADLLGDLKKRDKRNSYLDLGGQCWYVLGCDKGKPIGEADEIPMECGVMVFAGDRLEVIRVAPKRWSVEIPFPIWMALAKSAPVDAFEAEGGIGASQLGMETQTVG